MPRTIGHDGHALGVAWPAHVLRIADLSRPALDELLELAARMKAEPDELNGVLAGKSVACFLDPPTTGMTAAAATAAHRLGALPVVLPKDELLVGSGEPLCDIVRTFSATSVALVPHALPHRVLERIAAAATRPVVNALSDRHRPCQALADLLTLRERFGDLHRRVLAFVGDASDGVAHSLMEAGALAGMDVRIACPADYRPDRLIHFAAEALANLHGGSVTIGEDVNEAVSAADAVYATPSVPPGREAERHIRLGRLRVFQVHPGVMRLAKPDAVFMHCLPARRGEEVSAHVIDGRRSVVWDQVANRVPAIQAVLYASVIRPDGGG